MVTARLLTAEDLLAMGDEPLYELIEGELHAACLASLRSSMIAALIGSELLKIVDASRLGIVTGANGGYILRRNPDTVVMPDAAFLRKERIPKGHDLDSYFPGAPDLAVEVVSPSNTPSDLRRKVALYAAASVPIVWVIHPKQRIVTIQTLGDPPLTLNVGDTLDGAPVLPGFTIAIIDLFQEPDIE